MPRQEYIDFLKANGATAEDITALTEGPAAASAIRSFDAAQARITAAAAAADKAARDEVNSTWNKFYTEEVTPKYTQMEQDRIAALANEARAKTALLESQDEGLRRVAATMGFTRDDQRPANPLANDAPPNFDPKQFVSRNEALKLMEAEGNSIALAQDIAAEHATLFPGQRLNWRELRREAVERRISIDALWSERYKVPEARSAADAKAKLDAENAIRADERKKAETEFASKYANPDMRPLTPSNSPFTPRPQTGRDKMPWDRDENEAARDRVTRATQHVMKEQMTRTN